LRCHEAFRILLLIVCANIANLMLVKGLAEGGRPRSAGVRRVPIAAHAPALTESVVLALLGGAGGLAIASLERGAARVRYSPLAAHPVSAKPDMTVTVVRTGPSLCLPD